MEHICLDIKIPKALHLDIIASSTFLSSAHFSHSQWDGLPNPIQALFQVPSWLHVVSGIDFLCKVELIDASLCVSLCADLLPSFLFFNNKLFSRLFSLYVMMRTPNGAHLPAMLKDRGWLIIYLEFEARSSSLLCLSITVPICVIQTDFGVHTLSHSVQSLSHVWLFATPWTAVHQASLSIINSWSLLKLMSFESLMPSNHLILCNPILLLPSLFPSIRVFSNESVLHIRWL